MKIECEPGTFKSIYNEVRGREYGSPPLVHYFIENEDVALHFQYMGNEYVTYIVYDNAGRVFLSQFPSLYEVFKFTKIKTADEFGFFDRIVSDRKKIKDHLLIAPEQDNSPSAEDNIQTVRQQLDTLRNASNARLVNRGDNNG